MALKPDADEIAQFVADLPALAGLEKARRWWSRFVFRSDHVENIARVLNSGRLLSRARAETEGVVAVDAAKPSLVTGLSPQDRDWARLYFRPRAPTQWANEGVRPAGKIEYAAHMPVPVYMLFDSVPVLTKAGVVFTKGRMTDEASRGNDVEFLRSMNWRWVFHDSGVGPPGTPHRGDILNARHSEVLVLGELDLRALRWIFCRSAPEKETLLQLLEAAPKGRWAPKIRLEGAARLFCKRATHIQEVTLAENRVTIRFYTQTLSRDWRGPFALHVQIVTDDGRRLAYQPDDFFADVAPLRIRIEAPASGYDVRVTMDGRLVYVGRYDQEDEPYVF